MSCGVGVAALTASGKKSESIGASARASKRVLDSSCGSYKVRRPRVDTVHEYEALTKGVQEGDETASLVLRA